MKRAPAVTALLLVLTACERRAMRDESVAQFARADGFVSRAAAPEAAPPPQVAPVSLASRDQASMKIEAGRMLIRTGSVTLRVDTLDRAMARLRELAGVVGAVIASSDAQTGDESHRAATVGLRIAAADFDRTIEGLRRIGVVENVNVQTQDVGEEYVDVAARVGNNRRLEQRLLNLLATRTGKLSDVVEVEHELARVRGEIESLEARRRYLETHVSLSTVTVSLHEPYTIVGEAGPGVMAQAFAQSWENFVALVAAVIRSLGIVVPLGAVVLAAWALVRRYRLTTPSIPANTPVRS